MQRAFDVYRGDKMEHQPVTFLRALPGKPWVRYEGFPSPDLLAREYRDLINIG
jgi:protein SCO1/2